MGVASIVGLLEPALDEGSACRSRRAARRVVFLLVARRALARRDVHVGALRGAGVRRSLLVLGVLFVHSLPEGFAIGTAFASEREGLGLFILLAIALQNVPEGTASAIPMQQAGFPAGSSSGPPSRPAPRSRSAPSSPTCSSSRSQALLPFSFAFAAGAMLALVAARAGAAGVHRRTWRSALAGAAAGALAMLALSALA